ncbi:MAG: AbrB/MazE/SpoVT family DNA-binding domain-containing protein [Thaumarchaeota archaeon]|nr:AbrB/MazE/SpoVT family DNA-binding domain-containing protein [Nitrososphaerota archaeon]
METVKVSKKYRVVIPEKLRQKVNIKSGDKMVVMAKHGILQYVPIHSLAKTKGMVPGLDTAGLRDETFTKVPSIFDLAGTSKLSRVEAFKQTDALREES